VVKVARERRSEGRIESFIVKIWRIYLISDFWILEGLWELVIL
jgi:hypothetical protein